MLIDILKEKIIIAFKDLGYEDDIRVIKSNRPDLCDYQCDDVFKLAKINKKKPTEVGEEIVKQINKFKDFNDYFKEVTFANPGFINIVVSDKLINEALNKMVNNEKFNLKKPKKQELFFLDYGGANVAKTLHVGHLRPAIIGESIKRIIEFVGHKTISDVHLGDYGLQIGQVIYAIIRDKKEDIDIEYLNKIYPEMNQLCKEDENILQTCQAITKSLQDGNLEYKEIWKKVYEVSVEAIKELYDYLDVSFDLWEGESDCYQYIDEVENYLKGFNLLKKSDGALIIDIEKKEDKKEMPPFIFRKGNGAYLYGTTDLAAIYQRMMKHNPDYILYVVDFRQSLHFEQLFRVCEKWNLTNGVTLKHLALGTVNGKDGKPFKTRSGEVASLEYLLNQVKENFKSNRESNENMGVEDLDIITNSIIKFADLQNNREKDYIFDIEKFSEVSGKTGPYILYSYLRINKIIKSQNINVNIFKENIYNTVDRDIRLKLTELELSIDMAFNDYLPSYIAEYLYELCCLVNIFYQTNHIANNENEEIKQEWLLVLEITSKIIKELLHLLVIKIPSEM